MTKKSLGNFLQTRRKELGLSQEEVGKATGYTFQAISLFENNVNVPSLESLYNYAQVLNCSMNDFFDRVEISNSSKNTPINIKIITQNIKIIRRSHHFRQEDLCKICNVSIRSLRNYEKGVNVPSFKFIENFLDYFQIRFIDLLNERSKRQILLNKAGTFIAAALLLLAGVGIGVGTGYRIFNKVVPDQDTVLPDVPDCISFSIISNSNTIKIGSSVKVQINISPGLDFYEGEKRVERGYNEKLFDAEVEVNEQTDEAKFTLLSVEENIPSVFHITATYKGEVYTYSDIIYLPTT